MVNKGNFYFPSFVLKLFIKSSLNGLRNQRIFEQHFLDRLLFSEFLPFFPSVNSVMLLNVIFINVAMNNGKEDFCKEFENSLKFEF